MNIKCRTDEELGDLTHYLSQYDFQIKYSPGRYNVEADCLSRNPVLEPEENLEEQLKIVNMITIEDILQDQNQNEYIQSKRDKLYTKNNVYYKKVREKEKIIISEKLSIELMKKIHSDLSHIGIKQMQKMISTVYTAENMTKNIKIICESCTICIKNKSRGKNKYGLMSQLGPAKKPFQICSIDTIGGFGGSRSTKRYLHLLSDHFTRYAYILTSSTQNANDFIKLIKSCTECDDIELILSDQYPGINSRDFKSFLDEKNIQIIFTAVNSPFSNGLNERLNQTLVNKIRCKINEQDTRMAWTTVAHNCVKKYNETVHTVTGYAPKYLLYGTDVTILPNELKQEKTKHDLIQDRRRALENSIKSHNYNKTIYDKHRKYIDFNVGDTVFVENGNKLNRKKLDELKIGPYKIIEKISTSIYKINTDHKRSESNYFHISKLTPAPAIYV
ncbi:uncharacterized protein LOC118262122 isoform X2 [Spodoptera frugiperda]|nr:uncharacterized protein LOC118262122 isoform X2 [Spodoptera frugiperda]